MARGTVVEGDNPPLSCVKDQINSRSAKLIRDAGVIGGAALRAPFDDLRARGIDVDHRVPLGKEEQSRRAVENSRWMLARYGWKDNAQLDDAIAQNDPPCSNWRPLV